MKNRLLSFFLCLPFLAVSQIEFQEITSPDDLNIGWVAKSPQGEYFVQAWGDLEGIYNSTDGQSWTRKLLPEWTQANSISFFSDGTPVLFPSHGEPLIRRNGEWFSMNINSGSGNVKTAFVKGDTLFAYENATFAYSLNKGMSFIILFEYASLNNDQVQFSVMDNHFVVQHSAGSDQYLSIFTMEGVRTFHEDLAISDPTYTHNSCGEVLIHNGNGYYRVKSPGFAFTHGGIQTIIPEYSSGENLRTQDGIYYLRSGNTIYSSPGCDLDWKPFATNELIISNNTFWITSEGDIFLNNYGDDFFIEEPAGSNTWAAQYPEIHHPYIYAIDESHQGDQAVVTSNAIFSKSLVAGDWIESDSQGYAGFELQYSPDGDLYINRRTDILYSNDNGQHFTSIAVPTGSPFGDSYRLDVVDDDVLFITTDFQGVSYYSLNNGLDWIEANISFISNGPTLVKLVNHHLIIAELHYDVIMRRIDIRTNETTSIPVSDFAPDHRSGVLTDDGTLYFYGRTDLGQQFEGLYRYTFGDGLEFLGQFPEISSIQKLISSGGQLFALDYTNNYFVFDGEAFTEYTFAGLPDNNGEYFSLATNDYLYSVVRGNRLFRSVQPLSTSRFISGSIYDHLNQHCVVDTTDGKLAFWQVRLENENHLSIRSSDHDGEFAFIVPDGLYTVAVTPPNSNWDVCETSFAVEVNEGATEAKLNFLAEGLLACAQLELDFSTPLLRRCFENQYTIRVRNTGPDASLGTILNLELDPFFEFISASIPYTLESSHKVKFDLGVLDVNAEVIFKVNFRLSCDADLGAEHCLIGTLQDDHGCGDRSTYKECQTNIGSYDPNDKRVFNEDGEETERVDKGEFIYYHIRFQNTGTDTAFNVKVLDPLSPMLDFGSLEMLSSSHPYSYSITDGPALLVEFNDILLVDSFKNEPASHGYFKFRIKPLAEFDYSTEIPNEARIYFDFNEAVVTNEANVVILPPLKVADTRDLISFAMYPNPTDHYLTIQLEEKDLQRVDGYGIINTMGQQLVASNTWNRNSINVRSLAPGMYNLVLKEDGKVIGVKRFAKMSYLE